jgi:anthranilate phosphoribosyltransferase
MKEILKKLIKKEELTENDIEQIVQSIEQNNFSPIQMGGILCALESKKATSNELAIFSEKLIRRAEIVNLGEECIDVCGTGGDGSETFNISTAAMFVAAGGGVKIAKHGNKAVSSTSGSYDVLEALGVNMLEAAANPIETMKKTNIAFLFAQKHHPIFKNIGPIRKELGVRTIFNMLGPLLNPGKTKKQLMGVFDPNLTEIVADAMKKKGLQRAMVVNGEGLDEITTTGKTKITELNNGEIRTYYFDPKEIGIKYAKLDDLKAKSKEESAKIIQEVLSGKKTKQRDIVILNAAAAFIIAGKAKDFTQGKKLAEESIDSKKALKALEELKKTTNEKK